MNQLKATALQDPFLNALRKERIPVAIYLVNGTGEAARMLGINVGCLEGDRPSALEALLAKFNSIAVLKGAGTLIGRANGEKLICDRGNPGMATAGMGDVLSGMIGGLMSQGLPAFEAAGAGVWLHASAGDLIAKNAGAVGMLASDLIRQVPHGFRCVCKYSSRKRWFSSY